MTHSVSFLHSKAVRILLVGEAGAGKTALSHRFITGEFDSQGLPTTCVETRQRVIRVDDELVTVELRDTVGQQLKDDFHHECFDSVHAVVIVFDSTDRKALLGLPEWLNLVQTYLKHGVLIFIVGTKFDLDHYCKVSSKEVQDIVNVLRVPVFETSSFTGDGVDAAFMSIVEALRIKYCSAFSETMDTQTWWIIVWKRCIRRFICIRRIACFRWLFPGLCIFCGPSKKIILIDPEPPEAVSSSGRTTPEYEEEQNLFDGVEQFSYGGVKSHEEIQLQPIHTSRGECSSSAYTLEPIPSTSTARF